MLDFIDAYKLNWNPMTVEGYDEKRNEVAMVFNCDISTEKKSENVITYVVGRTLWCCKNFPFKAKIVLSFDIRGQDVIMSKSTKFKEKLLKILDALNVDNLILIDFLR
jgi:hypothetical protein